MSALEDKVAIVTGGNSMLGGAIVRALHGSGASVVIAARDAARGLALESELSDRALFVATDVGEDVQIAACVDRAREAFGGVDILVNNAVVYLDDGLDSSREQWLAALNVNLVGGAIFTREVVGAMRDRGGGAIVNVASVGGKFGAARRACYPAAKAAILQLTRNEAAELAPLGIRVNSISPGWTWSDQWREATGDDRALADRVSAVVQPLGRAGDPEEVAAAVVFLCGGRGSSFITGTDLAVDGGFSMLGPDQGLHGKDWLLRMRAAEG